MNDLITVLLSIALGGACWEMVRFMIVDVWKGHKARIERDIERRVADTVVSQLTDEEKLRYYRIAKYDH